MNKPDLILDPAGGIGLDVNRFRRFVADHLSHHPHHGDQHHAASLDHETGADWLRFAVLPPLVAAWRVLSDAGIGVRLEEAYDQTGFRDTIPTITFQCIGPLGRNPFGRLDQPKSDRFFFGCDGRHLILGRLAHYINSNAALPVGSPEPINSPRITPIINATLETAVTHYFEIVVTG